MRIGSLVPYTLSERKILLALAFNVGMRRNGKNVKGKDFYLLLGTRRHGRVYFSSGDAEAFDINDWLRSLQSFLKKRQLAKRLFAGGDNSV